VQRLDYWKAKLSAAKAEERARYRELNQMERAFQRAVYEIVKIERRIEDEETKLADAKRQNSHAIRRRSVRATD
jgi:phage-related minor tail protein